MWFSCEVTPPLSCELGQFRAQCFLGSSPYLKKCNDVKLTSKWPLKEQQWNSYWALLNKDKNISAIKIKHYRESHSRSHTHWDRPARHHAAAAGWFTIGKFVTTKAKYASRVFPRLNAELHGGRSRRVFLSKGFKQTNEKLLKATKVSRVFFLWCAALYLLWKYYYYCIIH